MASQVSKKILVMSDSHGDRAIVQEIKDRYQGKVDAMFHNGDSELASDDPIWEGIQVVLGNCDYRGGYPETLLTQVGSSRVAQTHGHLFSINYTWQKLDYWAQEMDADICLYGHLHMADAEVRGKTLFLNPGSLTQPRGLIRERLYAIVTIEADQFRVAFYTTDHQLYAPLSKDFSR